MGKSLKGIALYSGGLDSILAIKLILEQGIEVIGITFRTPFFDIRHHELSNIFKGYGQIDFNIRDITKGFFDILSSPKYGYGKNINPCIDCKILMLKESRAFMEESGAEFVFTGEVLGQRPMSQRRDTLGLIEKGSGLYGRLLRPLSAKLLTPTIMEKEGLIDREKLLDISGRSRKRQIEMVRAMGWDKFPAPGGGCLLTDPCFAQRINFLLERDLFTSELIKWLKCGRLFYIEGIIVVIGRNHKENEMIMDMAGDNWVLLKTISIPGPTGVILGDTTNDRIKFVASLIAGYSDAEEGFDVEIGFSKGKGFQERIRVFPMSRVEAGKYKV